MNKLTEKALSLERAFCVPTEFGHDVFMTIERLHLWDKIRKCCHINVILDFFIPKFRRFLDLVNESLVQFGMLKWPIFKEIRKFMHLRD